jgi:hypothetical protein
MGSNDRGARVVTAGAGVEPRDVTSGAGPPARGGRRPTQSQEGWDEQSRR